MVMIMVTIMVMIMAMMMVMIMAMIMVMIMIMAMMMVMMMTVVASSPAGNASSTFVPPGVKHANILIIKGEHCGDEDDDEEKNCEAH